MSETDSLVYSLTFADVVDILKILDASTATTRIDVAKGDLKIHIERVGTPLSAAPHSAERPQAYSETQRSSTTQEPVVESAREEPGVTSDTDESLQAVRAPITGVFYRAPQPGAAPFVEPGQRVDEDTVIGIIEVMKLMNNIKAGVSGIVVDICAEDGLLVEFENVLLRIDPSAADAEVAGA